MKQPIYVVKKSRVIELIEQQSLITPIPYRMDWGILSSKEELIDAVSKLKCDEYDRIHLSRLTQCFQLFYTTKMIGRGNILLRHLWELIKKDRETK
jgi:hypothetical protein